MTILGLVNFRRLLPRVRFHRLPGGGGSIFHLHDEQATALFPRHGGVLDASCDGSGTEAKIHIALAVLENDAKDRALPMALYAAPDTLKGVTMTAMLLRSRSCSQVYIVPYSRFTSCAARLQRHDLLEAQ